MAEQETIKMVKLKNKGGLYRGYDEGLKKAVAVGEGEVFEVSEAKAEQLKSDFPDQWVSPRSAPKKDK